MINIYNMSVLQLDIILTGTQMSKRYWLMQVTYNLSPLSVQDVQSDRVCVFYKDIHFDFIHIML